MVLTLYPSPRSVSGDSSRLTISRITSRGVKCSPGLFIRLLRPDADQPLEHVAHLHVVHALGREVDAREPLDDLEQQVLLVHARDLHIEREALHDLAHVGREVPDVGAEVLRDQVGVVQQPFKVEPGGVVERPPSGRLQQLAAHVLTLRAVFGIGRENVILRRGQHAIEAPQHGQRQDDLAVLVALVGPAQQVADGPDEVDKLGVRLGVHPPLTVIAPFPLSPSTRWG